MQRTIEERKEIKAAKELAIKNGEIKYSISKPCSLCGTNEKYVTRGDCVLCSINRKHNWNKNNPEWNKKIKRDWARKNKDKISEQNKRTRLKYPDMRYGCHVKRVYGITIEEYKEMFNKQNGLCAICESSPGKRRLNIDHDHDTGVLRGLLCGSCNPALGSFNDDVGLLRKAIEYLERYK